MQNHQNKKGEEKGKREVEHNFVVVRAQKGCMEESIDADRCSQRNDGKYENNVVKLELVLSFSDDPLAAGGHLVRAHVMFAARG